jgi:hypothetical protein
MKKSTTITYNIETDGGVSTSELEYKDYVKNEKGEENLLHYKVKNVSDATDSMNIKDSDEIKALGEIDQKNDIIVLNESFNKIYKLDNMIDETIGISKNNDDWKIKEYKNHTLNKEYNQGYNDIKFDINYDLLQKCEKNYIKE